MRLTILIAILGAAACGSSHASKAPDAPNGGGSDANNTMIDAPNQQVDASVDAPPAPATITISGTANSRTANGAQPVSGATIAAYNNTSSTAVATTTTNAQGAWTLTINTGGIALDGYIKASLTGYVDSYLYSEAPIAMDETNVPINMLTSGNYMLLSALANGGQTNNNGVIAIEVLDAPLPGGNPIAGATITTNPAGSPYRYDAGGLPNGQATATDTDGIGYGFNEAPGAHSVTAHKSGLTFKTHTVKAYALSLTTTFVSKN